MSIKSFTKVIPGIGTVMFERSKKAKSINISVKPFEGIRVAVPFGLSYQQAEEIVKSKRRWLEENIQINRKVEEEHLARQQQKPACDRKEAREVLTKRLQELANQHGFTYNRLFMRCQKTKWGSCSSQGNINLNVKLLELPAHLIDYVILHELVHLQEKNHGVQFWEKLGNYVNDPKKVDKELKKYRLGI